MSEELEVYDFEEVYDNEISPLMAQIIEICKTHKIPMVFDCQYANTEGEGPGYCTTALAWKGRASPKILKLIKLAQPERPVMLLETTVTKPDGSKEITIQRV